MCIQCINVIVANIFKGSKKGSKISMKKENLRNIQEVHVYLPPTQSKTMMVCRHGWTGMPESPTLGLQYKPRIWGIDGERQYIVTLIRTTRWQSSKFPQ